MKMAKKLLAVVLTGVMAVSMLTGCALGDAVAEKELLNKMNTFGAADSVEYAVEKKDGDFDLADARDKAVKAVKDLDESKDPALRPSPSTVLLSASLRSPPLAATSGARQLKL